jgi:AraC family transcriptional regulator, ethanolamine operon transcriptional activator
MLNSGLLGRFSIASRAANDAWIHGHNVSDWSHTYEQLGRGSFLGVFKEAWLGPIQVCYETIDRAIKYDGRPWHGSRLFFSYLSDSGSLYYDNRSVGANVLTTHRWDGIERVTCNQQLKLALVAIDEAYLNRHTQAVTGREFFGPGDIGPVTYTSQPNLVGAFQRCVIDVLRELSDSPAALEREQTRHEFQSRILNSLVAILMSRPDAAPRLPPPSTRAYVVDQAIQFMESKLAGLISIADVCAAVRVCPRTLGYSFEEVLGISPSRYLMSIRLSRVRRDLLSLGNELSVQSIAAHWGFWHMGRFARYYRDTFGERPSDTIRARGGARRRGLATPALRMAPQ